MENPINNQVNTVFIPVKDIEKAKEWYGTVLGIEGGEIKFGHLFVADMDGTGLVFDEMPMWRGENGELPTLNVPAIQFSTNDVHASYQFMKAHDVELVSEVMHDHFFVFKDPDGNMLMLCQC
jgi:catechol 2,3-dioxygenase-like lactoylglutathione lyase family enzyme